VASFATLAKAQDSGDLQAIFDSAAKEATNVNGVRVFAGPPKGFDPLKATDRELASYGLPQRPDKTTEPRIYQNWERAMQAAKHRAPAKLDVKSLFQHKPETGSVQGCGRLRWSEPCQLVQLEWHCIHEQEQKLERQDLIPGSAVGLQRAVAQPPFGACGAGIVGPFYEVSWNGIDGFSNGDVVQGGSLSAADCNGNTAYEAWVEWFPSYPILGVFGVNPGDDMYVVTYGFPGTSTQQVFVEDITTQTFGTYSLPYVTGPGLVGSSAEWIVERPCCASNGFPLALANTVYDFFNYDFAGTGVKVFYPGSQTLTTYNITMLADDGVTPIEYVQAGKTGPQGLESLWFYDSDCAYSGGCTP